MARGAAIKDPPVHIERVFALATHGSPGRDPVALEIESKQLHGFAVEERVDPCGRPLGCTADTVMPVGIADRRRAPSGTSRWHTIAPEAQHCESVSGSAILRPDASSRVVSGAPRVLRTRRQAIQGGATSYRNRRARTCIRLRIQARYIDGAARQAAQDATESGGRPGTTGGGSLGYPGVSGGARRARGGRRRDLDRLPRALRPGAGKCETRRSRQGGGRPCERTARCGDERPLGAARDRRPSRGPRSANTTAIKRPRRGRLRFLAHPGGSTA